MNLLDPYPSSQAEELNQIINFIAFLLRRLFSVRYLWQYRKEKEALNSFYSSNFTFYNLLNKKEKRKFLIRIIVLKKYNDIKISEEINNTNNEIELLICGAFAQITFGYSDYKMGNFSRVRVYPNTFYSKLINHQVKGLTVSTGYIFFSWKDFLSGYKNDSDKINLALHELAHALYIDRFHNSNNYEWDLWKARAEGVLEEARANPEENFFRTYGKSNVHEFWAVAVEIFFEDPINLKKQYPSLYACIADILKQDMAKRIELCLKKV